MRIGKIERYVHIIFWVMIFASVNVAWTEPWFDRSIRPNTPAPLLILIFPIFFYVNAFILLPKYFNREKWHLYILYSICLFILPELIRSGVHIYFNEGINFSDEIFSRDSFLFGAPSPFFLALNTSFIYRFTMDWFANKSKIEQLEKRNTEKKSAPAYENIDILTEKEAELMSTALEQKMLNEELFLNADLSLRELADGLDTSEKKLSFLLNQKLDTNFYEMLNKYRVEKFKEEIAKTENQNLSIVGLALNCGFQSKSSFYRAFKSEVGTSPSSYLKKIKKVNK